MYITEIFEAQEPSSILVIYPGRFQPWHKGHKMVYDYLTKIYGRDHVFVATSNKVDPPRSPFTFSEKQQFMHLTGINADRIVETRDPYRALEIVQKYNPKTTRLVLAVSEKDMAEDPRFKFGYKKDGSPTYLQQMPKSVNDMQPFETHGYIMTVPTFDFTVLGEPMRSATQVRAQFAQADASTQQSIIKDLFGTYDRHVHDIMKQKLLPVVTESVAVGTKLNLTKNYGNFETLTGVVKDITPSGKLKIQITQATPIPGKKGAVRVGDVVTMASNYIKNTIAENFADGKNPQDKGDAKRHGINTKASVSSLRKTAKSGGRKGQLAHWLANMKAGRARAKNEGIEETINPDILNARFKHKQKIGDYTYTATAEDFEGAPLLWIKAYDGNKQVGEALFEIIVRSPGGRRKPSADYIESGGTEVDPEYRNKGIASTMYAYAKMLGNDVQPSTIQRSDGKAMWAAWAKSGAAKHLVGTSMEAKIPQASGQNQVNQQNKKFILYLNNQAIAEFDTEYEARQQGQVIVSRVPNTQIEIKQEICTLSSIELKENLKKCVHEAWSQKYKNSINCANPKGFSQKAHCASKNEDIERAQKKNGLPNISLHQALDQQGVAEGKIKLSTDPNWYGAEVGDYRASGPVVNIPTNQLVGFEPDDKMNQPASKANVEKIVAGLKQGAKLPPLMVRQYKNGYQVLDGHHRFWAYKLLGAKSIPAQVVPAKDIEEITKQGVAEGSLNEFAPIGGNGGEDDPYNRPEPKHYSRSIDFFGKFEADHFDREDMNDATGEFKGYWNYNGKLTQIAYFKFDNSKQTGSNDPGMGWYYEPNEDSSVNSSAKPAVDNSAQRKRQELSMIDAFLKSGQKAKPGSQIYSLMKKHGMAEGLNEFAPGGNSASSYYAVTANFVNEFAQQKQEELQDLIDSGWTKQDLAQAGTLESHESDIAHFEQVRDGFLKGLKPGFDAYLQGDTQLKDQLGEYWLENDLPLNQDWEKIYGEPWGRDEYNEGVAEDQNLYRRPTAGEVSRTAQQTQAKLNPTASKFVWKRPNQIGGSYSEQDLTAKGFKKSQYNSWGGTQAMWDRLTRVSEQLNQPTPTAQQILDKHNLTVEEFVAQLRLGVKVEFEHTKDAKTAYEIALDHLNERPDYYTKLMNAGLESIGEQSGSNNKKVNYREVGFFDAENYIENRSRVLDLTPAERNAYNYGYKYGASTRHRRINPSTGKPYIIFDKNGPYSPLVNPIYTVPIEEIPTEKSAAITALQKKLSSLPKDSKVYEKYKAQLVALSSDLSENSAKTRVDLTPNYPNYSKLIGEFMGVNRNQKAVFKILAAELKPGQGTTDKIARSVSTGKLVAIDIARVKNRLTVAEAASGYIPTKAEKDDPRFKTALTVDVRPGTDKKNMRALRLIK